MGNLPVLIVKPEMIRKPVTDFILHRPPMLLIDELIDFGTDYAVARLRIRPELMFYEAQGLPTWVGIEIMAQTVSLFAGVQGHLRQQPPKIGYLLGTRKLTLPHSHFALNSELTVRAEQHYIHDGLGMFNCRIDVQHPTQSFLIESTLSVYEPHNGNLQ